MKPTRNDLATLQSELIKNSACKIRSIRLLYIDTVRKKDIAWNNLKEMLEKPDEPDLDYLYGEYQGEHVWPVRRNLLYNFAKMLFRQP